MANPLRFCLHSAEALFRGTLAGPFVVNSPQFYDPDAAHSEDILEALLVMLKIGLGASAQDT